MFQKLLGRVGHRRSRVEWAAALGLAFVLGVVGTAQASPSNVLELGAGSVAESARTSASSEASIIGGGAVVHAAPPAAEPVAAKLSAHASQALIAEVPDLGPEPGEALPPVSAPAPGLDLSEFRGRYGVAVGTFDFDRLPGRLSSPSLRSLWREGLRLERDEYLLESAARYELIVGQVPEESFTYWRIARNYWRHGEGLPVEDGEERVRYFEMAEDWSARGLSIDPECAPCMLWKFVSMGRQATTRGLLTAVSDAREMDWLLKQGIALQPSFADDSANSTLGNLYYAGAVFYRIVPDWFWVKWVLGMRGDKDLSLEFARKAVAMAEMRVDYRVELGASLLCYGATRKKPLAIIEGFEVLRQAEGLDPYLSTDHLDKAHAQVLLSEPQKACGYSRDGFIDVDEVGAGLTR
jgi:hypothetical protein